jgi:hypothetical protein
VIVETDHSDVLRDPESAPANRSYRAVCHLVGLGKQRGRRVRLVQQELRGMFAARDGVVAELLEIGPVVDPRVLEGANVAGAAAV